MKITLYMDVYPGMESNMATAWANPPEKTMGNTRYVFDVEIPDPKAPDVVLPMAVAEKVEDKP